MAKIVADSHTGGTGKATIAAHLVFVATDRGPNTLLVDLDDHGNASDTATQRGLHPALILMESELLDDVGFDTAIFYAAENVVTPDGKARVNSAPGRAGRSPSSSTPRSPS
jgi:cellulose biosynthesis protein BcsQ